MNTKKHDECEACKQLIRENEILEEKIERLYQAAYEALRHMKETNHPYSYEQAKEWLRKAMAGKRKWKGN